MGDEDVSPPEHAPEHPQSTPSAVAVADGYVGAPGLMLRRWTLLFSCSPVPNKCSPVLLSKKRNQKPMREEVRWEMRSC